MSKMPIKSNLKFFQRLQILKFSQQEIL